MSKKKKGCFIAAWILLVGIVLTAIWMHTPNISKNVKVKITVSADRSADYQVFFTTASKLEEAGFNAENSSTATLKKEDSRQELEFDIPANTTYMRLDCGTEETRFQISSMELVYKENIVEVSMDELVDVVKYQDISSYFLDDGKIEGITAAGDPYLVWDISKYDMNSIIKNDLSGVYLVLRILETVIVLGISLLVYKFRKKILEVPSELYANRKLIFDLAKTDFKSKYASSYLGVFWAFVQPVVTIGIYVFVFQVGFKAAPTNTGYPFLLYLVAGIIPWFFFAESWLNATNCLVEYNYLVKKVVFKISILPIVKVISSLFVHVFFIGLALIVFVINGSIPGWTFIQIIYYLFCTICLSLALSYFTAAIVPFFQDTVQIINIITQISMWTIPIMYDESIMGEKIMKVLRFNPMYYVVTGYRDCYMHGQWFWNKAKMTIYFWGVVCILFYLGFRTFKKLRVHFADVL